MLNAEARPPVVRPHAEALGSASSYFVPTMIWPNLLWSAAPHSPLAAMFLRSQSG